MAVISNGKTSLSVTQGAKHLLSGGSFAGDPVAGTTLTYSFRGAAPATMPDDATGFTPFNPAQIRGAELALQSWADVANIHFVRIGAGDSGPAAYSDQGVIRFADYSDGVDGAAAFTYLPAKSGSLSPTSVQGDAWFNGTLSYNAAPALNNYGQKVLVHEIGHALGLSHPGDYDGDGEFTYANAATFYEDSRQYTTMSYFSESNTGAYYAGRYASVPLLLDIAAIQRLYGPNTTAFLGDTVFGFNSNAGRPWLQATDGNSKVIFAVWDAGGIDTFDFSGFAQAQTIDLNETAFSNVGGLIGNVSIAKGVTIENAIGGTGADTIVGNAASNYLRGMNGNDSVNGGAGDDDLNGNQGGDTVDGELGADTVRGGQGSDLVLGGLGDDPHVNGNLGDDTVRGGDGNDTIYGGQGADQLFGDAGADLLSGDLGSDTLTGGAGADRFRMQVGGGDDVVLDFNRSLGDRIVLAPGTAYTAADLTTHVLVTLTGGGSIDLAGVAYSSLTGEWLIFG